MPKAITDYLLIVKCVIVTYILFSTFFDFNKNLTFLDNKLAKILLLSLVVLVIYYDLHTGILLTIAFLMIIIQFNNVTLTDIQARKLELFSSYVPAEFDNDTTQTSQTSQTNQPEHKEKEIQSVECDNTNKNEISDNIFQYSIDPKVKPYEVFVKMMTTQSHLDDASNAAFLQPDPLGLM
jgi:hypothetical protein